MLVAARLHLHGKDLEHQYTKKKLMFLSEKAKGAVNVHFKEHANMVTKRGWYKQMIVLQQNMWRSDREVKVMDC